MDVLKQKGKDCKAEKADLLRRVVFEEGQSKEFRGDSHIKEENYGEPLINGMHPLTNRYVKKMKEDLKREYRGVKRGEKQKLKKEIQSIIDEE